MERRAFIASLAAIIAAPAALFRKTAPAKYITMRFYNNRPDGPIFVKFHDTSATPTKSAFTVKVEANGSREVFIARDYA
jgi:hypothetical protein